MMSRTRSDMAPTQTQDAETSRARNRVCPEQCEEAYGSDGAAIARNLRNSDTWLPCSTHGRFLMGQGATPFRLRIAGQILLRGSGCKPEALEDVGELPDQVFASDAQPVQIVVVRAAVAAGRGGGE